MNAAEPVADSVTGVASTTAFEPMTGMEESDRTPQPVCLNCRAPLLGHYCHACGQKARVHRSLGSFGHDLLHGVFHFEGKIWRTLPLLAWRPGELTRRYIEGERASFVSPFALFLFSVFLLATVLSSLPGKGFLDGIIDGFTQSEQQLALQDSEQAALQQRLQQQRDRALAAGRTTATIDDELAEVLKERSSIATLRQDLPNTSDTTATTAGADNWLDLRFMQAKANPQLLFYKIKTSAYKYSWVLVPMSMPFLWLLFPFSRRFRLYDHAIFTVYSLSFMSLLTVLLATLGQIAALKSLVVIAFPVLQPIHLYLQLRGAYRLGRWSALWRAILLVGFAAFVLTLWIGMLMILGAF